MSYSVTTTELASFQGEEGRSPAERWLPDGHFQAIMRRKCAWTDRNTLVQEIGASGGELYPHNTQIQARAYAANVVGVSRASQGDTSDLIAYEDAIVTIFYSTMAPYYTNGKFLYEAIEPYSEYVTLDPSDMRWTEATGDPLGISDAPGKEFCGFVYVLQFFHVQQLPPSVILFVDGCNESSWASYTMGLTFNPQTLLYKHPSIRRTIQLGSTNDFQVTYRLYYRGAGWNKRWKPNDWHNIYLADGTKVLFHTPVNFNYLIP